MYVYVYVYVLFKMAQLIVNVGYFASFHHPESKNNNRKKKNAAHSMDIRC